jgi:hypothetical protein
MDLGDPTRLDAIQTTLRQAVTMTPYQLKQGLDLISEIAGKAHCKAQRQIGEHYRQWLAAALKNGGKQAHALTKAPDLPPGPPEELVHPDTGEIVFQPMEVAQLKAEGWMKYWNRPLMPHERPQAEWLNDLKKEAQKELTEQDDITVQEVQAALARGPSITATGCDNWNPKDWARLPVEAHVELTNMLNDIEKRLQWPAQVLAILVALLGKPTGGDRPISLTAGLYRAYSRIRKPLVTQWESKKAGHWDTAVRQSSALRSGLLRQLGAEVCRHLQVPIASLLWDMEKFYDTMSGEVVCAMGIKLNFPAVPMYLGLLVHLAARSISTSGCLSEWLQPRISLLAGCMQSIAWSRCFLYDILQEAHDNYRPLTVQSWVDDLAQQAFGERRVVRNVMVKGAVHIVRGLQRKGGKVSASKSVLLVSDRELRDEILSDLSEAGISLNTDVVGRDLGVDANLQGRRRLPVFKARFWKGIKRAVRTHKLVRTNPKAKALLWTGTRPQATWGHQVMGLAPTPLKRLRGTLATSSGLLRAGGCTSSALAIHMGTHMDPAYFVPREVVLNWLTTWPSAEQWHRAIVRIWSKVTARVEGATRWHRVLGPLGTLVATLLDIGWDPVEPLRWVDHTKQSWDIDPLLPEVQAQIIPLLDRAIDLKVWRQAATHNLGRGLEQGVDWFSSLRNFRFWRRTGQHRDAGIFDCFAQGAVWDRSRKKSSGYLDDPTCTRCGSAPDSVLHMIWECPANSSIEEPAVAKTQHLCQWARDGAENKAGFWLRGLMPWQDTLGLLQEHHAEENLCTWGRLQAEKVLTVHDALCGTDGSGGPHGRDPRLRRVGWGLVVCSADLQPLGIAFGGVPDQQQSVPRAELYAILKLAVMTQGSLTAVVDADYVCKGFHAGRHGQHESHHDLWRQLWQRLETREGSFQVCKVRSHLQAEHIVTGSICGWQFYLNAIADSLADRAAVLAQLPPSIVRDVTDADLLLSKVQKRLVALGALVFEAANSKPEERERAVASLADPLSPEPSRGSAHDLRKSGNWIRCHRCRMAGTAKAWRAWQNTPCMPSVAIPVGVHRSHRGSFAIVRGLGVCLQCGSWVKKRLVNLAKPCKEPKMAGQAALAAIARGDRPQGLPQWPDEQS